MRDKVITGLCCACLVVLIAAGSVRAADDMPPPRAPYWKLIHLYPLVVVASWDEAEYQEINADRSVDVVRKLRLRVHRVLKGKCGKTVEVHVRDRFTVRRGAVALPGSGGWINRKRDVNRWAVCCNVQFTNPGGRLPSPVRRDARRPAVYFLTREEMLCSPFEGFGKWGATSLVLRGAKLHELPHLIPPDPKGYFDWEGPEEDNAKGGGAARKKNKEWVISALGQIQPRYMANGWAALLAGKKPDAVFRYFQRFDPYSRKLALKELQQCKDRKVWANLADEAINDGEIPVLDFASSNPLFRQAMLSHLSQMRTQDKFYFANVWDWAIYEAPQGSRNVAAKLLAGDSLTVEQKQTILRRLKARAPETGGEAEAVLIARRLSDASAKIRDTARDCLVDMLVARGGTNPGPKQRSYNPAKPGAMKRLVAALEKDFGQAGWAQIVRKHPQLKTAQQPRPARQPQKSPSRKPTRPEDVPAEKYLQQFKQGWLPKGPATRPWRILAENVDKDFALPVMAKALLTADIPDGDRERCLASLVEAAVAYPERVRVALSEHGGPEFRDILAVQCFLDPATDAGRLAEKLKGPYGVEGRRRRRIYAEAVFVTDTGLNLLREIIKEGKSRENKICAALVVAKWLEPAQSRMVLAGMKHMPEYLRVKMIVKQPLGKAERAQAIKTLRGLVARVKKTGRPVHCRAEEFKSAEEAAKKLGASGQPKAMEALADFLLQRPYDADSRGGQYRPWWGCKKALGDLYRGSLRQFLRVKADLKNDEDDQWAKVVRESRAGEPQWVGKKDMLKALASLSAKQSQDRSQLRLSVLGYYGTKVSDPRSAAGIAALARAMFGQPDSSRAAPYSQRYERACTADLVERVIAHEFGLRGTYAIRACEHLPEKERVEKLSAILTRLAKTRVNGGE